MMQDDARNKDGSCSGSLIIFPGMPSTCHPPGLNVGEINNCCKGENTVAEDIGNGISNGYKAIQMTWDLARIGYYSYYASLGQVNTISQEVNGVYQTTLIVKDANAVVISSVDMGSFSPQLQAGINAGIQEATQTGSAAGGAAAGTGAYISELASTWGPVIGMAVFIVMQILYGYGCSASDVATADRVSSGECHYVGDYCDSDVFFGCEQRARTYCCFNSMLARIIQEQGRPQLTTYGPTGNWGTAQNPNCSGLTPDEFQQLDFSKIDFTEYIAVIQKNLSASIKSAQDKIQGNITNRVQQQKNNP
jgi:conjugal transfer mating pair stabilization protein TraN